MSKALIAIHELLLDFVLFSDILFKSVTSCLAGSFYLMLLVEYDWLSPKKVLCLVLES